MIDPTTGGEVEEHDPVGGVGTQLSVIFSQLGFSETADCNCAKLRKEMNQAGPAGVRERFDHYVRELRSRYDLTTWQERAVAGGMALLTGLAWRVSIADPVPDVLNEAIRRAEATARP